MQGGLALGVTSQGCHHTGGATASRWLLWSMETSSFSEVVLLHAELITHTAVGC